MPVFLKLFLKTEEEGILPNSFCQASITNMKAKDTTRKQNYAPISLMNIDAKILSRILTNRIQRNSKRSITTNWDLSLGLKIVQHKQINKCGPYILSRFSQVWVFVNLWIVAHQAALSMGFSRQEYWSGLPWPPPEDLPNPGIEPKSLTSPALAGRFFTTSTTWGAYICATCWVKCLIWIISWISTTTCRNRYY